VFAEGPFGVFTESALRRRDKVLLVARGIGITPIRAMVERMRGDVVVIYRVFRSIDLVVRGELEAHAARTGAVVHYVVGDHRAEGARLLAPES
jgi:NAD(P)H-flavin reductase